MSLNRWIRGYRSQSKDVNAVTGPGSGDVIGPASSVDNTVARYNGTSNKTIQGSPVTIDDNGELYGYRLKISVKVDDYTTVTGDSGKTIEMNVADPKAVTLDPAAPVGVVIDIVQKGAGQITIQSSGSGTVVTATAGFKTKATYSQVRAYVTSNAGSAAVWVLSGDTAA